MHTASRKRGGMQVESIAVGHTNACLQKDSPIPLLFVRRLQVAIFFARKTTRLTSILGLIPFAMLKMPTLCAPFR
jgi:hypothetical protein